MTASIEPLLAVFLLVVGLSGMVYCIARESSIYFYVTGYACLYVALLCMEGFWGFASYGGWPASIPVVFIAALYRNLYREPSPFIYPRIALFLWYTRYIPVTATLAILVRALYVRNEFSGTAAVILGMLLFVILIACVKSISAEQSIP